MKKLSICTVLFVIFLLATSQIGFSQSPDWTRLLQMNAKGTVDGKVVTADNSNLFFASTLSGEISFENQTVTNVGIKDLLIIKMSFSGNLDWIRQFNAQTNGIIIPFLIQTDDNQNIYIAGDFKGTLNIGTSTITSPQTLQSFVAKFDNNGNGLWATAYNSTGSGITKMAIDQAGSCFVLSKTNAIIKFNNTGTKLWEQNYPIGTLQGLAVKGNFLYLGGALKSGTTNFGTLSLQSGSGVYTSFLVRADLNGQFDLSLLDTASVFSSKAGMYHSVGIFNHPTTGIRIIDLNKTLIAMGENVLVTTIGDLISGTLKLTINPNMTVSYTGSTTGTVPVIASPDSVNIYDPVQHKFYLHYQYDGANGTRYITEELTFLYASGPSNGSTFCDLITRPGIDSIYFVGSFQTKIKLGNALAEFVSGNNTYIGVCDLNLQNPGLFTSSVLNSYNNSSQWFNRRIQKGVSGNTFIINQSSIYKGTQNETMNSFTGISLVYNNVFISPTSEVLKTGSVSSGNLFITQYDQNLTLEWNKESTNEQLGYIRVNSVKHDHSGNTYFHSRVSGKCNYLGANLQTPVPLTIISKVDINGNLLWTHQIPDGIPTIYGNHFNLNQQDELITKGRIDTTLTLGSNNFVNADEIPDQYIVKFGLTGSIDWAVQLEVNQECEINSVVADYQNNVVISGYFSGQLSILGNPLDAAGGYGVFIIKLNENGGLIWAKAFPIGDIVYTAMVDVDQANNIYMAGELHNATITFGGISIPQTNSDGSTIMTKFDPSGNPLWVKSYGGVAGASYPDSWPVDMKTDANGNSYLYGWCTNHAEFGNFTLNNPFINQNYSYYLTKINNTGDVVWAKAVFEKKYAFNYGDMLDLDYLGNIYFGGHFKDSISIDNTNYVPLSTNDFFLTKMNNDGVFQWMKTIPSNCYFNGIGVYTNDVLSIAGNADEAGSIGGFQINALGGSNGIVATLGDLSTDITKYQDDISFGLYPNPCKDKVQIFTNIKNPVVSIFDVNGRLISIIKPNGQWIDVSKLTAGEYIIEIFGDKTRAARTFLKQ